MIAGGRAFRAGLAVALRYWQVWLLLYATNLISALLLAAAPAASLLRAAGRGAMAEAADGVDAWIAIERLTMSLTDDALGLEAPAPEASYAVFQVVAAALLMPLLVWIPAAFLSGGALLTYVEAPEPFRLRRFAWGCWRWFGSFLALGLVQSAAALLAFLPLAMAAVWAVVIVGRWLVWLAAPALGLAGVVWFAALEMTGVFMVAGRTRNFARAFGAAVSTLLQRPAAWAGMYALALLLLALLHGLYRLALLPALPLAWWPLVLLVQQSFVGARLWARLVRLAGGAMMVGRILPKPPAGPA